MRPHSVTNSNQIVHGNAARSEMLLALVKVFLIWMLTRDLFAVANLLVYSAVWPSCFFHSFSVSQCDVVPPLCHRSCRGTIQNWGEHAKKIGDLRRTLCPQLKLCVSACDSIRMFIQNTGALYYRRLLYEWIFRAIETILMSLLLFF